MDETLNPDGAAAWQLRVFQASWHAPLFLRELRRYLSPVEGKTCLDVGGEPGVIPLMLRRLGGAWVSVSASSSALASLQFLLGEDQVFPMQGGELPFDDASFDTIVVLNTLEKLREDALFLRECHRCLKPKGELILLVPQAKSFSVAASLKKFLGFPPRRLGQTRPGYKLRDLYEITKDGYDIVEHHQFGGAFTESLYALQLRMLGETVPLYASDTLESRELRHIANHVRVRKLLRPFYALASGLDAIFSFTRNHYLVIQARPRPWLLRKSVKLKDGRSIAEATIQTRIGTAAELVKPLPGS